jgi:hypothetical protein
MHSSSIRAILVLLVPSALANSIDTSTVKQTHIAFVTHQSSFDIVNRHHRPNIIAMYSDDQRGDNTMGSNDNTSNNGEEQIRSATLLHRYDSPFFECNSQSITTPAALIILNTPFVYNTNNSPHAIGSPSSNGQSSSKLPTVLDVLWKQSSYRVCADGGANRLYEATVASNQNGSGDTTTTITTDISSEFLPDMITGDLDSLQPHVKEYYERRGVPIVRIEDQDYHDLDVSFITSCVMSALYCFDNN